MDASPLLSTSELNTLQCDTMVDMDFDAVFIRITTASIENYVPAADSYDFRYRAKGSADWIDLGANKNNSRLLSELLPDTEYEFQTRYFCVEIFIPWSFSKCFKTRNFEFECNRLTGEGLGSRDTLENAQLVFCDHPGVRQHQFRYRCNDDPDTVWIHLPIIRESEILLTELEPGKTYALQCRGICPEGELSDWSQSILFEIEGLTSGLKDDINLPFTVYPNPVIEQFQVRTNLDLKDAWLEVFDQSGIKVIAQALQGGDITIGDLRPGMYNIRLRSGQHIGIQKVIVRD